MRYKIYTLLAFVAVCCLSCSKDDEVSPEKIEGEWYWDTTYPHLITDVGAGYIFRGDNTYTKRVYGFGVEEEIITEGTYVISIMGKPRVLSLGDGEKYVEQYYILKLDSKEVRLEATGKDDFPREMKLLRK